MQVQDHQKAADVLNLTEPYSTDDVNAAADAYEAANGVLLVRPGEWDHETQRPNKKFETRLKSFKPREPDALTGDPAIHRRELRKALEVAAKKGFAKLTPREIAGIHELQKALDLPLTDFTKKSRTTKQIMKDAQATFVEIQKASTSYQDRLAAVKKIADIQTLELFSTHDKSEEVRDAAFERIQQVQLEGVPEV